MGFMSGLLGLATAFTNFSAIWILDIQYNGYYLVNYKNFNKSIRINKAGSAVLPLVEVLISYISAVQY